MNTTVYTLPRGNFPRSICFALVSDLHGEDPGEVIALLKRERPDYILMPGDIAEPLDGTVDERLENALTLLREAAKTAPTFYSMGNHEDGAVHYWFPWQKRRVRERHYDRETVRAIEEAGVTLLCNRFVLRDGIAFGGLSSGLLTGDRPDLDWLQGFCATSEPRVLLCHHPEYFKRYLRELPIDLTVSGHAHGGQWRFFGRGVFAPGQGILPKYTSGVYEGRLVVSRGLKKSGKKIPRIFNEPELVLIRIE